MNKKIFMVIGMIAMIAVGVFVYMHKEDIKAEEIKIGAILPLTGEAAVFGVPVKNAIELQINASNANRAKKVKILYEDSQGDNTKAISAFQKLAAQNVKLIIGPMTSGEVLSLAPLANQHKIIIFSPSASASDITNSGEYVFRNELSDAYGAKEQARLAIETLHWKSIAVAAIQNDYGVGVKNIFEQEFKRLGGQIVSSIVIPSGNNDYRTQILQLRQNAADAIFIIAQAEYPNIIRQIRESGVTTNLYATPVFEDNSFLEKLDKNAEGVIYTFYGNFDLTNQDGISKLFIENYKKQYNIEPSYYAALGYDNAAFVVAALSMVESTQSPVSIFDAFRKVQSLKGVTGEMIFDRNGDVQKPVILKIVNNNTFRQYGD